MKLLILCLFFGIICANVEEKLVQMVEELKSEFAELKQNNKKVGRITDLKNEIKNLKISMSDQEERIQANEDGLKGVDDLVSKQDVRIQANEEDLKGVDDLVSEQEARIQANEDGLDVSICYLNHKRKILT